MTLTIKGLKILFGAKWQNVEQKKAYSMFGFTFQRGPRVTRQALLPIPARFEA
jgi:hypothetical protein